MADSMYLIAQDAKEAKKIFKAAVGDSDLALELVGEKESQHITVWGFSETEDGRIVIEIPRTLKGFQTSIIESPYGSQLKTREGIGAFLKNPEDFDALG